MILFAFPSVLFDLICVVIRDRKSILGTSCLGTFDFLTRNSKLSILCFTYLIITNGSTKHISKLKRAFHVTYMVSILYSQMNKTLPRSLPIRRPGNWNLEPDVFWDHCFF